MNPTSNRPATPYSSLPPGGVELPPDTDWEKELVDDIGSFSLDPFLFTMYAYDWRKGELADSAGPRRWQKKILEKIRDHLQGPLRFTPLRIAVASGHGIGKSALVSMVMNWGMSTCEDCKIVLTATTGKQLSTKTWPEHNKWTNLAINKHWWEMRATSVVSREKGHEHLWRTDAITWSEENMEAFSGLHNKGKRIIVILDEASGVGDKIWETTEGALTDEGTEIIWLAFGNPTQNTGRFCECFGSQRHRWQTMQIDSRQVEGTNKAQIDEWIKDYGEDSDFVRIRVRGEFPRSGSTQLIPSDVVQAARHYKAVGFAELPKILSVDVARYGDDQTVIGIRQGRQCRVLGKYRGLSTVQATDKVIEFIDKESPDAYIIDGDGIGASVVDQLEARGYKQKLFEFHGAERANDVNKYFNKRAECWGLMNEWLASGAEIPDDPEMAVDLTGPQYGFSSKQQIQLEKKEDMKKRGLASPDHGDMLAMTFSVKVAAKQRRKEMRLVYPGQLDQSWMN
jgi:hypothetical protein